MDCSFKVFALKRLFPGLQKCKTVTAIIFFNFTFDYILIFIENLPVIANFEWTSIEDANDHLGVKYRLNYVFIRGLSFV